MAELIIQNRKQQSSESDTVGQRKGATVLRDNRGQVTHAQALPDNRTAKLEQNSSPKPNNTGLPNQLKAGIESLSGMSMDYVKVHYNSAQPTQLNACAYAQGREIHVAPGQERHLPHEAWHVVQQAQRRVQPTMQMQGWVTINDDQGLEQEADAMGARALGVGAALPVGADHHDRKAAGPVSGAKLPIQRHIYLGKTMASAKPARVAIAAYRQFLNEKSLAKIKRGARGHAIFLAMAGTAFAGRQRAILDIIEGWLDDDVVDRGFKDWQEVVVRASLLQSAQESAKSRSPEELEKQKRLFNDMAKPFAAHVGEKIRDPKPGTDKERDTAKLLPELKRKASSTTDLLAADDLDEESTFLAIRRRKKHRSGDTDKGDLPGKDIRYRSYAGTISPKANAFVLGGSLAADYAPLMKDLVQLVGDELRTTANVDRIVARLFLQEMAGEDAFQSFSNAAQSRAHKIIAVILFAEFSRHSIGLLTAAAAFHAVATRTDEEQEPKLVDAFATCSGKERPLFAGTNGPEIMRGEEDTIKDMKPEVLLTRRARGVVDLLNFLQANRPSGGELIEVVKHKTLEFLFALAPHTNERSAKASWMTSDLYPHLTKLRNAKKEGDDPLLTLKSLGFTHNKQSGENNNCAIYSLYHQLTVRHHLHIPNCDAFVQHIRAAVDPMGNMIDLLTDGQSMIDAAQDYIANTLNLPPVTLTINVWAATGDGSLMEFNNVVRSGGEALPCFFYFNGVNHFDSLTGDPV